MKKEKDKIGRDNIVRIYDNELLDNLNDEYANLQGFMYSSKNVFLNDVLKLGVKVLKKQNDDNWAIKNETTTLLDAIHEHTKRMNFFIKFSQPFIKTAYADCEINQMILSVLLNYMIVKMNKTEKEMFFKDLEKYINLQDVFVEKKKELKKYYTYQTE
ncbi:MAG: hypothetical protein ACI4PF_02250 [Christensenellales bacterium]